MSTTIDERVVEMRFDNQQFEKNIHQSMSSLDELKKSLDLNTVATKTSNFLKIFGGVTHAIKGGITGLGNITKSVKNFAFSLTGLNSILANNASKMTSTLAALTGGAIASGFEEYELKVNSVRTILSNVEKSGKSLGDVTEALEELNKYADKTIYNFAEMTRNIGYFTVAGVGLEESVSSIKGFMNLAALQGVDATAAARATYQLSQAMSTGSMRLMDWRSMENAGMGGKNFQEMLIAVGKSMGVQYDNLLKKHKSFRETLSEGWLTSDVMLKTLQLYSGDFGEDFVTQMSNSGYAINAFNEALRGNTEQLDKYGLSLDDLKDETGEYYDEVKRGKIIAEAMGKLSVEERELETIEYIAKAYKLSREEAEKYYKMAVKANAAAKEVTTFRKLIDALSEAAQSGWSASWEIILGNVEEAKHIFTPISDEIGGILQASADARNKILSEWKKGTVLETITDEDGNVIKKTYKFFEAIANIYAGLKSIGGKFKEILNNVFPPITSETLIKKTEQFFELSKKFRAFAESEEGLAKFAPIFNAIGAALKGVVDIAKSIGKGAFNLLKKIFSNDNLAAGISKVANAFASLFSSIDGEGTLSKIFGFLADVATPVINFIGNAISWLVDIVKAAFAVFKDTFSGTKIGDFFTKIPDIVTKAINKISAWSDAAGNWFKQNASFKKMYVWGKTVFDSIKTWYNQSTFLPKIGNYFKSLWNSISSIFKKSSKAQASGKKLPDAFKDSVTAVLGLDEEDQGKEQTIFQKIGSWLIKAYTSVSTFIKGAATTAWSIISSTAVWIYNAAKDVGTAVGNVFNWIAETGLPGIFEGIKTVIGFLGDIIDYILEIAPGIMRIISSLALSRSLLRASRGLEMFGHGFEMLGEAIDTLADAKLQLAKAQRLKSLAVVILSIGALLAIIVGGLYALSKIPKDSRGQMWNGILAVTALLGALTAFTALVGVLDKTLGAGKAMLHAGAGLLAMSASIILFVYAIKTVTSVLGNMTITEGITALSAVSGILIALIITMKIIQSTPNVSADSSWKSILAMTAGMILVVIAVKKMTKVLNKNDDAVVWEAVSIVSALLFISSVASRISGNKLPSGLLGTAIALVAFVGVIHLLAQYKPRQLTAPILTIAAILASLSVLARATGGTWKASLSLIAMVGVLVAITKALMDLTKLDPLKLGVSAASLAVVLLSIAKFSATLGTLRISQALRAVVNFGVLLVGIAAVVATMGWLFEKVDGLSSSATKRNGKLNTFGAVIGEFIGEIVGGFAAGASSRLGEVADNLCVFGEKIAPFLEDTLPKFEGLSSSALTNFTSFTTALSKLSSPETDTVTGGIAKLGKDIKGGFVTWTHKTAFDVYTDSITSLLSSIDSFISTMDGFNDEKKAALDAAIESMQSLFTTLGEITLPEERVIGAGLFKGAGWVAAGGMWIERAKLEAFSKGIASILPAMSDFIENVDASKVDTKKLSACITPFQDFIVAVSDVSLPTESWTADLGGFVSGVVFNAFVRFENTKFESYAKGVGTLLASAQEFIRATDGITVDTEQLKLSLEAFKDFIVQVSGVELPKESTSVGFSVNNLFSNLFGGPEKIIDTYFEEYNTTFLDLSNGIDTILGSLTTFKEKTDDLVGEKKTIFDAALAAVVKFLDDVASVDPRTLSTVSYTEDSEIKKYFEEQKEDLSIFSNGISTILSSINSFSVTALLLSATGRKKLETALGLVVNFMEYVSRIDPQTLVKKEYKQTTDADGQTIATYFETKFNTFSDFGTGVENALSGVDTLIKALDAVTSDGALLTNLGLALDAIASFVATVSEHPLPLVSELSYDADENGVVRSYLEKVYNSYDEYGTGIGQVISSAATLLSAFSDEGVTAAVKDGSFEDTLKSIVSFINATTANPLPVISEESSNSETNAEGTVKSYMKNLHTSYDDYAGGIGQLMTSAISLIGALDGVGDIDVNRFGTVLDLISTFIGQTSTTPLPTRFQIDATKSTGNTSVSDFIATLSSSYGDYAGGISTIWDAAIRLIAAMEGKNDSDIVNLDSTLTVLSKFLSSMSNIELPNEDYKKMTSFTNIIKKHNTKFEKLAEGVGVLLDKSSAFIDTVKDLTGTQQTNVATAFGDLVSFINAFNGYKLPTEWSFSFTEGFNSFYDLTELSGSLGPMGEGLAQFYKAIGDTEGVVDVIKELNKDIDSSALSGSAKAADFFGSIFNLFNSVLQGTYMVQSLEGHTLTFEGQALTGFLGSVSNMISGFVDLINDEGILSDLNGSGIFQLGVAFVKTISNAMAQGGYTDEIESAFEPIVTQITDVLSAFGIEFESSGKSLSEKFRNGLVSGFRTLSTDLNSNATSELATEFKTLQELLQSSLNSDLTIRPVLDMSGIESDIAALNGLTGEEQLLNFKGTKKRVEVTADLSTAIDGQISRVVTAVDALGPKIDAVGQSMKSIRVWIDGSVLAGYLLPTIDSGLASSANRSARGAASSKPSLNPDYSNTPSKVY